jgi:LmbE family N-acetylglucosaminyl deacetylase
MSHDLPGSRIVVVSPHSDDGVLSLGAAMAGWARSGARVELLTVFALDPESAAETRGWDRRAGFRTEAEAARARRGEDAAACRVLGAQPVWLPFGSVDYERHGDEGDVAGAVSRAVEDADVVFVPGSPLTHPDHAWLAKVLDGSLARERLDFYAEQPYTRRSGRRAYDPLPATRRDRVAKWRAIRCYRSQLPLLALSGTVRRGPLSLAWTEEQVARGGAL